jgi:hypothetical protein
VVDRPADEPARLIAAEPVVPIANLEPVIAQPEPEPEPEPEVVASPAPGLLNDHERKRMDLAMAGLSRFGPVADPVRPAPRTEVDALSSVSAADWSGMDGMGEELAPLPPISSVPTPPRREPAPAPAPAPIAAPVLEPVSIATTDPIKGWVTADRLFSDFGD